ncbi:hypothetical protein LCGC14_2087580 [marine sediment metagenome]|uniref:Uncharacterized protein n=1 Tax=marine sediment metagenome TaxID=412755 RepID=A0A0F9F135_9ZZZZ
MKEDELKISKEGLEKIDKFRKDDFEMYVLMNLYVGIKFMEMCEEELDEKDYKRIMKCVAFGV